MNNEELTPEEYDIIFGLEMSSENDDLAIKTLDGKEVLRLITLDDVCSEQCYKKGNEIREQLPKYWFLTETGVLISVKNEKAYIVKKDIDILDNSICSYHFNYVLDDGTIIRKSIKHEKLMELVFEH